MAVRLIEYPNLNEQMEIQESASAGLKSMENLIRAVSNQQSHNTQLDCRELTDFAVSKFRNVISILNRTGHARFRRAPVPLQPQIYQPQPQTPLAAQELTLDFTNPGAVLVKDGGEATGKDAFSLTTSGNSSSAFLSSITGEGSVSNGKSGSPSMFLSPAVSAGKPPLSGKRCLEHDHSGAISGKTSGSSRCHCKKRYAIPTNSVRFDGDPP